MKVTPTTGQKTKRPMAANLRITEQDRAQPAAAIFQAVMQI